jgi:hypothetical protein
VNAVRRVSPIDVWMAASAAMFMASCASEVLEVADWSPDAAESASAGPYIEAESGQLSGGVTIGDDSAASGQRYIAPPAAIASENEPGNARARYVFRVSAAGTYLIWGRIRSPSVSTNRFWIQLDGGTWYKWRITVGDIWYWDDFHSDVDYGTPLTFPFSEGNHELLIANCVDGVALDRLFFAPSGQKPESNDTTCDPPHSIQIGGICLPSCGSLRGSACGETACAGHALLPAYDCGVCCQP